MNGREDKLNEATAWLERTRDRHGQQDWDGCLAAADETLLRDPDCLEAELMRATALLALHRPDAAVRSITRVIETLPDDGGLHIFHARCLMAMKLFDDAIAPCQRAVSLLPDSAEALYLRGACLKRSGDLALAEYDLQRSVALSPRQFQAWNDLADIHIARGAVPDALDCLHRSLAEAPYNLDAISSLCFYAAFDARSDAASLFDIKRNWGRYLVAQSAPGNVAHLATSRPDGRIRIGYLAEDLNQGITARFLEPVLARHDRQRFHITGYHGGGDGQRLNGYTDSWQDLSGEPVERTVDRIQRDGIDILVLVSSYRGRDLRIPAHRAAPVQICYLNRIASTGLDTVDYLITDELSDPTGRTEQYYTEKLVRLSNHTVYRPPATAPVLRPLPCIENGFVTFGSFNNHAKINDRVVETWSRILDAVPRARLILRSSGYFDDPVTRDRLLGKFINQGVELDRLEFQGMRPTQEDHLAGMLEADIALDPFPFNGGTTSCEVLWVGLPLVTLATDSFMGRQGLRCLTKTGIADLASDTIEDYIANAVRLANDQGRLIELRRQLPIRVETNLFNYDNHVHELETAYQYLWLRHLDGCKPGHFTVENDKIIN